MKLPLLLAPAFFSAVLFPSCSGPDQVGLVKDVPVPISKAVHPDSDLVLRGAKGVAGAEADIHELVSDHRVSKKQNGLKDSRFLDRLARQHSEDMRRTAERKNDLTYISHDKFDDRYNSATGSGKFLGFAENVAVVQGVAGEDVAPILVNGWFRSKGHYKNIRGNYTYSGVGVVIGKNNTVYATQLFGRK